MKKKGKGDENRMIRKLEKWVKETKQMVAWLSKKIYRRKAKRKATKKEKIILERLRSKLQIIFIKNKNILKAKKKYMA